MYRTRSLACARNRIAAPITAKLQHQIARRRERECELLEAAGGGYKRWRRSGDPDADGGGSERRRKMKCPVLLPGVEQFELAVHEPPEHEGGAEADERCDLWNERVVGCGDAEPDDPLGTEIERDGDGHCEQHSRRPAVDGAPD